MPRHDATNRIVNQSLFDIDADIAPISKHRLRSNTRYTSISVKSSNVSPLSRSTTRSRQNRTSSQVRRSTSTRGRTVEKDADVIQLRSSKRSKEQIPPQAKQKSKQNPRISNLQNNINQIFSNTNKNKNSKVVWYPKKRARIFSIILLLPFVLISLKLIDIQILNSKKYTALGVTQRSLVRDITPARGTITDRNGNILAVSEPAFSVVADPKLIKNSDDVLTKLRKVTVFNEEEVAPRLENKKSRYAMILRQVDEATAKRVQRQKLPGITIVKDPKREYPSRDIASNVIGFVGYDMNGMGGVEFMLDSSLAGKKGKEVIERDPKGREIPSAQRSVQGAVRGNDVSLTLDEGLQYEAQNIVLEEVKKTGSKNGTAIIADIKTGEILSMVSIVGGPDKPKVAPSTDSNHAVTDVYEPGSTNKVITISGALEEKIINPNTTFTVPDSIEFDDKNFVDAHSHEPLVWNAGDILRESSNVGTIMISNKLKKKKLDYYLRAYGFGKKTSLNFPGEASGILLDPKDWSDTSFATVPVGYGLAVSPMQMLSVYMTIANNGIKAQPRLIKSFVDSNGETQETKTTENQRVISETTASQLRGMLEGAVEDGTGKLANVAGFSVAGKTGTARKPPYNKPPYRYMASFAGFAPAKNPRLAAIVILDEPQSQIFGGTVAAPVFSRIMQSALRIMAIQPDRAEQGQQVVNSSSKTLKPVIPVTVTTVAP